MAYFKNDKDYLIKTYFKSIIPDVIIVLEIPFEFTKVIPRGGDLVSTLPGCVCRKGKDMGPFSGPSE